MRSHEISCCMRPEQWRSQSCSCRAFGASLLSETPGDAAAAASERLSSCRAQGELYDAMQSDICAYDFDRMPTNCFSAVDWDSCLSHGSRLMGFACRLVELFEFAPWTMYPLSPPIIALLLCTITRLFDCGFYCIF